MARSGIEAPPRALGIGALSARTGVHVETVRYYERIGIMPTSPRTEGGHRIYDSDHLERLAFIRRARELGFSLDEVRGLLELVDGGGLTCGEVQLPHHGREPEARGAGVPEGSGEALLLRGMTGREMPWAARACPC
jgi:DNA-binding transcriptional MerR regulator